MKTTILLPDGLTLRDKVLAVFRAYNRDMTAKEVSTVLGMNRSSVACAVHRAYKDGLLSLSFPLFDMTAKGRHILSYSWNGRGDYSL